MEYCSRFPPKIVQQRWKSDGKRSRSRSASVGPGTGNIEEDGEEAEGARGISASREELERELESARDHIHELELELERACERAEEKTRLTEEVGVLNNNVGKEKEIHTIVAHELRAVSRV